MFVARIRPAVILLLPPRLSALPWTVASTCLFTACGGSDLTLPSASLPAAIRVVDGDAQSGSVGQLLPAPIVVQVTDARGQEVGGTNVEFALTSAGTGAEVVPSTATTDTRGRAQVRMLLGNQAGRQVGEARVGAGATAPKTTFSAMAVSTGPGSGGPPPSQGNESPQAAFAVSCQGLTCTFTDQSNDGDGTVVSWQWSFGDQATSTQRNPSHSYQTAGQYAVLLTVRDNGGAANTTAHQADPSAPGSPPPPPPPPTNKPPQAEFEVHCTDLRCTFTDRSSDDDGTIVSWHWDFGDGGTSTERNPSHSYRTGGRYQVRLTVTDNDGAGASKTHDAEPNAPPPPPPPPPPPANKPPHADFDVHCKRKTCNFSDKSTDEDGTIVSWQWSFGDGAGSSERNPVHTYADRGHYDVTLTVTDNDGATNSKTRTADVKN